MRFKRLLRRSLLPLSLAFAAAGAGVAAASCATVDTAQFREITPQNVKDDTAYTNLGMTTQTVKNLVYGTDAYNDGNYVLLLYTMTDLTQVKFVYGTDTPSAELSYNSEWGNAVKKYGDPERPAGDPTLYPTAIKFAMFGDNIGYDGSDPSEGNVNPYSKWPTLVKDSADWKSATQEERDNSGKYRRDDQNARDYRAIGDLILDTYSSEAAVQGWYTAANATIDSANSDTPTTVTTVMAIAFKNDNGTITHTFYSASTTSSSSSASTSTQGAHVSLQNVTVNVSFSSFLSAFYGIGSN